MSGAADTMSPRYARLSGEIADQGVLDALKAAYLGAAISHAYASTEAGVGFNRDRRPGRTPRRHSSPATVWMPTSTSRSKMIRCGYGLSRTAMDYLGAGEVAIHGTDGFVGHR